MRLVMMLQKYRFFLLQPFDKANDKERGVEMESTIELHTKGFKDFSKQLANITVKLRTVNAELEKANQLVKELIDLKDKLES